MTTFQERVDNQDVKLAVMCSLSISRGMMTAKKFVSNVGQRDVIARDTFQSMMMTIDILGKLKLRGKLNIITSNLFKPTEEIISF